MAGKTKSINAILNLKDNMSGKVVKVTKKVNDMSKEAKRASQEVASMANNFKKKVSEMTATAAKFTLASAGMAGAFAVKSGIAEAMDLEGYRMQLETATKSTKKAGEIMKYAVDLANKTPFEAAPLVEGASKLEAMGMSAKKYLNPLGDMAAATNKSLDQAIEARIDAQNGELERIKEFGITKQMIVDKADALYGKGVAINNKGQIKDQQKFNEALDKIIAERFKGGMEKQASTLKGMWSTVTGVTKSALAEIVGMQADGTVRQGSLYDTLKGKVKSLAAQFEKMQSDGTIKKISDNVTKGFQTIYNVVSKVVGFIAKNRTVFETLGVVFVAMSAGIKVAMALKSVVVGLQIVWALLNGTVALSPFGWIAAAIAAVIGLGYLLWKNWDKVKAAAISLYTSLTETFSNLVSTIGGSISSLWTGIQETIGNIRNGFISAFQTVGDFVGNIFKGIGNTYIDSFNFLIKGVNKLKFKAPDWVPVIGGKEIGVNIPTIPRFAMGTAYHKGGLAQINERGGEIVDLPNGSRVIPADKSEKMIRRSNGNIIINFYGNVYGADESFVNLIGNMIARKVKLALDNM